MPNNDDDFSNFPESVAERRSDLTRNAADWTPRDVLIALLRAMDKGEVNPSSLICCTARREEEQGAVTVMYYASSPNKLETLGLLTRVTQIIGGEIDGGR